MKKHKRSLTIRPVPISRVVVEQRNQKVNPMVVAEYYGQLRANPKSFLPPIFLRKLKNGHYVIRDGHHRFIAALMHSEKEVDAYIEVPK